MKLAIGLILALSLVACAGKTPAAAAEGSVSPPQNPASAAEPTAGEARTLTGTLRYEELPRTMSLEAYNGVEFFLTVDGAEQYLTESETVSHQALEALHGKRIEVQGTWAPPQAPNPMEASPGAPRPGRWAVQAARPSDPPRATLIALRSVEPPPAAARPASCPPLNAVAAQARVEAERLWAEGHNGEHVSIKAFDAAVAQWRVAALGGDVDAQYTLGVRLFSARFQESSPDAESEEEHGAYVEAMSWIAVAAQRGQARATTALSPWLLQALSDPTAEVKPDDDDPLASIPTAWIHEAAERAVSLRGCW